MCEDDGINVLSLFDGISCGQVALERAGINVNKYYASEIDKYAIQIAQKNYPDTIQLGDITNWESWSLPRIDLVIGGSPCQGFSFAGKQLNFEDARSKLFFKFVDILKNYKPKYFLLENVVMKKEYQNVISDLLGVEPIMINSALVSAQNRKRLYWTNILGIKQPEDKGILLKDIIETGISDRDKSFCLDSNYWKGGNLKSYFEKHRRQLIFSKDGLCHIGNADIKANDSIKRVYSIEGKAPTLSTCQGGHREPKILCGAWRGRYIIDGKRQDGKMLVAGLTTQRLEVRADEKTNVLTSVQKDNNIVDIENLYWRKLTPIECERLQTLPDNYTDGISNTQRYKCLGNGWTVDVVAHILKQIGDKIDVRG